MSDKAFTDFPNLIIFWKKTGAIAEADWICPPHMYVPKGTAYCETRWCIVSWYDDHAYQVFFSPWKKLIVQTFSHRCWNMWHHNVTVRDVTVMTLSQSGSKSRQCSNLSLHNGKFYYTCVFIYFYISVNF